MSISNYMVIHKLVLLIFCGLFFLEVATAQDTAAHGHHPARINLKFAPLALLDPDATVQGAVEVWVKQRQSVQGEFGYGSDQLRRFGFGPSPWTPNKSIAGKEVWRVRLEGRYYTSYFAKHPQSGTYIAIEGLYKQVNVTSLDTLLGGETIAPVFVYAPVTRHVFALHSKVGTQVLFSYNPDSVWSRFFIDFYAGLGIRHISVVGKSPETALLFQNPAIYERFGYSEYRPGDALWRLSISLGLKIGVSL